MRTSALILALLVFWCLLSGETINPWNREHPVNVMLLVSAVISCAIVVIICRRMNIIDNEGQPLGVLPIVRYVPWLIVQIIRANLEMARLVWSPRPAINPEFIEVPLTLKSALARTTYANSITLMPGTVTIQVGDDHLLVHALTHAAAEDLRTGEMQRRLLSLDAANGGNS